MRRSTCRNYSRVDEVIRELEHELVSACGSNRPRPQTQTAKRQRKEQPEVFGETVFFWEFKRQQIENQDFSEFMYSFGELPEPAALRDRQASLVLFIAGYDDDPRELVEIPEVRSFYQKFCEVFPYWLFFIDPESLETLIFSVLKTHKCNREQAGNESVRHEYDSEEMAGFIRQQMPLLLEMCKRAGMSNVEYQSLLESLTKRLLPSGFDLT